MGSIFGKQIELDKALDDLVDIEDLEVYRSIREEGERTRRGYSMYTHSEVLRDMVGMSEYHLKQQGYNLVDARVEFDDGKYYAPNSAYYKDAPASRMFAKLYFEHPSHPTFDNRMIVGFRNSMDKSMSFGIAIGAEVLVCSNLCISGSGITLLKKHVGEIREKVIVLATKHLPVASSEYTKIRNLLSKLKDTDITNDDAYSMLGRMYGNKVIRANEFTNSVRTFNRPTHSEYGEGTLNTLYQAVTEACGEQPIQKRLHTMSKVTDFVRNEAYTKYMLN